MDWDYIINCSIRLVAAMFLGGIIGLEREYRSKDAGFRTHFLVALGAALFTLLSVYAFQGVKDTSRVAAQVVSGIGFLGAGLIVFQRNVVRGLTTAAGLWVTAAVGMACGVGQFFMAGLVTLMVLVGLEVLGKYVHHGGVAGLQIAFASPQKEQAMEAVEKIREMCERIYTYEMKNKHGSQGNLYEVQMVVRLRHFTMYNHILDTLKDMDDVSIAAME